jgi:hypothetical protein
MAYRNKDPLELEADKLLAGTLKSHKKNKSQTEEYPILSDAQLSRRRAREIPFSNLSLRQKLEIEYDKDADDL